MLFFSLPRKFSQKGSLLVEVLIVVSIITVALLASLSVAQKSIAIARQSIHQAQVSFLLEEGAEIVRIVRDNAWTGISSLTDSTNYYAAISGGTWTLSTSANQIGIFTRTIAFSPAYRDSNQNLASSGTLDSQAKLVTVTVSWNEAGQDISKTLQFYIMDIFS